MKKHGENLRIKGPLVDQAIYIYSMVVNDVTKGIGKQGVMAACQFLACKDDKNTHIYCRETICYEYKINSKLFNKGAKELKECIFSSESKNKDLSKLRKKYKKPRDPEDIVRTVCNKLNINDVDYGCIVYVCRKVKRIKEFSSKMPYSIAAGCILVYLQYEPEQKNEEEKKQVDIDKIANMCTVSRNTADNISNDLKEYIPWIIPRNINAIKDCMPYKKKLKKYEISLNIPEIIVKEQKQIVFKRSRGRPRKNN